MCSKYVKSSFVFFLSMFSWSNPPLSRWSPTLADYLFGLHSFESVIVGQILTLCWNPKITSEFSQIFAASSPFLLRNNQQKKHFSSKIPIFLVVTKKKSPFFLAYAWWIPMFSQWNHHFFPVFKACLGGGAGVAIRGDLVGKKSSKWIHGIPSGNLTKNYWKWP